MTNDANTSSVKSPMARRPVILVSPSLEVHGVEFHDRSISLSEAYLRTLLANGALPLIMPTECSRPAIAEYVRRADGVLLSGGQDIHPRFYAGRLPQRLRQEISLPPNSEVRDLCEMQLVEEVFRQQKPLLAICRGHQLLNVALGGTLFADIATQCPKALNHCRQDCKSSPVHEVRLTADSMLAKITGRKIIAVNSTHHQAVDRIADILRATGTSMDGIIESMELRLEKRHLLPFLLAVQFHPERLADRFVEHRAIFRSFVRACAS